MRKLLNSPWFVTTLALAAVLLIGRSVLFAPKPASDGAPSGELTSEEQLAAVAEGEGTPRLSLAEALKELSRPAVVRDPFALPVRTETSESEPVGVAAIEVVDRLRLSAIWVQGAAVFLLLNGTICQPGDAVDRFTVESAAVEGAWIRHTDQRSFLPVGQEWAVKTIVPGSSTLLSP